jgi:hypothetical protein
MKKRDVRLTTSAHREAFDDFYEAFRASGGREGWRSGETLRHFLEAGYRAVRGRLLTGEAFEKNEAEYMSLVGRCRHPQETMRDLSVMLGALALAMIREPVDFVGPVFNEIAADAGMGQFFTPHDLSYLMAKMTLPERIEALKEGRKWMTLQEPACGVGGMLLATNVALREAGFDLAREVHWLAIDVDFRAMAGCYLQASLSDCSAIVVHGDTLRLQEWAATPTPAAVLFPKHFGERAASPEIPVAPPRSATKQLELF